MDESQDFFHDAWAEIVIKKLSEADKKSVSQVRARSSRISDNSFSIDHLHSLAFHSDPLPCSHCRFQEPLEIWFTQLCRGCASMTFRSLLWIASRISNTSRLQVRQNVTKIVFSCCFQLGNARMIFKFPLSVPMDCKIHKQFLSEISQIPWLSSPHCLGLQVLSMTCET